MPRRRKLEDFLTTALSGFERGYGRDEAVSLERGLLKERIKSNLEQKQFERNIGAIQTMIKTGGLRGYKLAPKIGAKGKLGVKLEKIKEPKPPKLPTKRASKVAQKRLLREYLGQQMAQFRGKESLLDRFSPLWSRYEVLREHFAGKGRYKTSKELFRAIGVTNQDFYDFAVKNFPEETRIAFPERRKLPERKGLLRGKKPPITGEMSDVEFLRRFKYGK